MCDGIALELDGIDLGDKRLNERSRIIIETLGANPEASCNSAIDGWSDTLAAYRFFDNKSVQPEAILNPHVEATKRRMQEHPVVLIAQDTTELDYSDHPPQDARCLNTEDRLGLYDHTHLALTPNGLSLGVVGVEYFDRDEEGLGQSKERSKLPIEEKESLRWLTGYRLACELARDCPETQIVSVADREADLYDIFMESEKQAKEHARFADFIIRARIKRSLPQRDPDAGPHAYKKVRDEVSQSELRTTQTIDLPRTPKRAARRATLEVRAIRVTVKPPHDQSSLPTVTYNVVLVEEVDGPGDGTDVSWLLITSLPTDTLGEIQPVIDYYVARWTIEQMFQKVTEVFNLRTLIGSTPQATVFQASFCLLLYNMSQVIRAYIAEGQESEVKEISIENLFYDVQRQLIAWNEVLSVEATVRLLSTTWTAAQVANCLRRLLHGQCRSVGARRHPTRIVHFRRIWTISKVATILFTDLFNKPVTGHSKHVHSSWVACHSWPGIPGCIQYVSDTP